MNIDATEDDLRTAAEALKLAAILDDRAPSADKARIAAWAEKLHTHQLGRKDVLDGLQAFYDSPSERAIQIGDLLHWSRQVRRDRNEREEATQREERRAAHDSKATDDTQSVAAGVIMGPTLTKTERFNRAEIALQCAEGRREAMAAITEFFAAKAEAKKTGVR